MIKQNLPSKSFTLPNAHCFTLTHFKQIETPEESHRMTELKKSRSVGGLQNRLLLLFTPDLCLGVCSIAELKTQTELNRYKSKSL